MPKDYQDEMYKCQSYYDDTNILRDCTCGKCSQELDKIVDSLEEIVGKDSLFIHKGKVINFLRTTLTTYGNARYEEGIREGMRQYGQALEDKGMLQL
jgi:hypothetical protein